MNTLQREKRQETDDSLFPIARLIFWKNLTCPALPVSAQYVCEAELMFPAPLIHVLCVHICSFS